MQATIARRFTGSAGHRFWTVEPLMILSGGSDGACRPHEGAKSTRRLCPPGELP